VTDFVNFDDASRLTGLTERFLRRLAASGKIRTRKLGWRRFVSVASLREFVYPAPLFRVRGLS
jgi:hypothetical protein